jgi:ribonuclease D
LPDPTRLFRLFQLVVDHVDIALERVDSSLDDLRGKKNAALPPGSLGATASTSLVGLTTAKQTHSAFFSRAPASSEQCKPQQFFRTPVDNSERAFVPVLTAKPHSVVPLPDYAGLLRMRQGAASSESFSLAPTDPSAIADTLGVARSQDIKSHARSMGFAASPAIVPATDVAFGHPYEEEIQRLSYSSGPMLDMVKEQLFRPLHEVPSTFVDTVEGVHAMMLGLRGQREVSIDLEHHDQHSFLGFTCLMQLSTRTHDFIVDCLALREDLHPLAEVFADPSIVKVLHGADMDILWLQRDLGLYIVNLFDTGQASRVLEMPSFGLAYLLKHYCDVNVDKKYQLADWRVRPIPSEMLLYARQDTHYLLYVYDLMRNELVEKSRLLRSATVHDPPALLIDSWHRSRTVALRVYEKPRVTESSHVDLCKTNGWLLSDTQMRVLRALFRWRDLMARQLDESTRFVLPNRALQALCQHMPADMRQVIACVAPFPPLLRQYGKEVLALITQARQGDVSNGTIAAACTASSSSSSSDPTTASSGAAASANADSGAHLEQINSAQLFQMAGWVENTVPNRASSSLTPSMNRLAHSISAIGPLPIRPDHLMIDLKDLQHLSASQRRLLESFDPAGFAEQETRVVAVAAASDASGSTLHGSPSRLFSAFSDELSCIHDADDRIAAERARRVALIESSFGQKSLVKLTFPGQTADASATLAGATTAVVAASAKRVAAQEASGAAPASTPSLGTFGANFDFSAPNRSKKSRLAAASDTGAPAGSDESVPATDERDDAADSSALDKTAAVKSSDSASFMASIGWLPPSASAATASADARQKSAQPATSFAPFDYTKAAAESAWQAAAIPGELNSHAFNPYNGRENTKGPHGGRVSKGPEHGLRMGGNRASSYGRK